MNTPVADYINAYKKNNYIRLHVPGHKGKDGGLQECCDITEIDGADVLYHETGILKESQLNASRLFGTKKTLYSTEGSSLSIRAMLALIKMYAENSGKKPSVAAGRNAHKVFMTASALLDIEVSWIYPENTGSVISADFSPSFLRSFLESSDEIPTAVYITSPDYLGNLADIKGIADVCREFNVLLVVDNAHGAYLRFLPENMHPISLGAHMCCDSAHKTLPVLTGGAYLHISCSAPEIIINNAERAMALFASTSPSYLILASLDKANFYISEKLKGELKCFTEKLDFLKSLLTDNGFVLSGNEPLKISLACKKFGYTGNEIAEILRCNGIECEFSDPDFVVLMFTPSNSDAELEHLRKVLLAVERRDAVNDPIPSVVKCEQTLSVKEALFKNFIRVDTENAVGRILASPCVTCPPAVPVAVCGEVLTLEACEIFRYYGIDKIDVIDE